MGHDVDGQHFQGQTDRQSRVSLPVNLAGLLKLAYSLLAMTS